MSRRARTASVVGVASALLVAVGVWGAMLVRADATHHGHVDPANYGPLSARQYAAAVAIAQHEVDTQRAHLTSATAVLRHGNVRQPNLVGSCRSGQEIRILLIGRFPHTTVSPPPGRPGGPVTTAVITADALSGKACLLGVGTGHPSPYRHSADLLPALDR